MLGFLQKVKLGRVAPALGQFFPFASAGHFGRHTRTGSVLHKNQFVDKAVGPCSELMRRSVFGVVAVYNSLPQSVVDLPSVSDFQSKLQQVLRVQAVRGIHLWERTFDRSQLLPTLAFQRLFS